MAIQEWRAIISLVTTIVFTALYTAFMIPYYPDAGEYTREAFRFWGIFFLLLIPVTIVSKIIVSIGFAILYRIVTREDEPSLTDERDRLIELKSARLALYIFPAGVILAMGMLAFDQPPTLMFILLIGAGVVSSILFDLALLFFYRRGV